MSVSVTTVNGLVVVTQVFKQGEDIAIPMNSIATPAAPVAAPVPAKAVESDVPSKPLSPMTKQFLRGQPKSLGIVQILVGLVTVALGIMLQWNRFSMYGAPLWSGSLYVLSGIVAAVAYRRTQPCLINSTMALNTLSCCAAVAAIVIYAVSLATRRPNGSGCVEYEQGRYRYNSDNYYWMCQEMYWKYWTAMDGVRVLLLVLSVVELAVALPGVIFAGKASCSSPVAEPTVLVVERPAVSDRVNFGSDEALLGSDNAPASPPPYDA